jgi:hypothetical protein
VKFNSATQPVRNELVRGIFPADRWRTSDGNFVVGGFDAVDPPGSTSNLTLLRKYDQNGDMLVNKQNNFREIIQSINLPQAPILSR